MGEVEQKADTHRQQDEIDEQHAGGEQAQHHRQDRQHGAFFAGLQRGRDEGPGLPKHERRGQDHSAEERQAATRDLYREELPPETLEKVERVLASQARKRAAFQAYQEESQAILNDPELSFEQRQELLLELSDRYNSGGF